MQQENLEKKIEGCIGELVHRIGERYRIDGIIPTKIPFLHIIRASDVSDALPVIYEPALLFIIQGAKRVTVGPESFIYDPTSYLVSAAHMPVSSQIIQASRENPYLCIRIGFTLEQVMNIVSGQASYVFHRGEAVQSLVIHKSNSELLEAVLRLIRLLDSEEDIAYLSPLILKEIIYRVLKDDSGTIGQFLNIGSKASEVLKVIQWINCEFHNPLDINALAEQANMSTSALYKNFKTVTRLSPLQYQKVIRLQEARRLLIEEKLEAASVSYQVGYESPTQFSREYTRLFGLPPISDIKRLRAMT